MGFTNSSNERDKVNFTFRNECDIFSIYGIIFSKAFLSSKYRFLYSINLIYNLIIIQNRCRIRSLFYLNIYYHIHHYLHIILLKLKSWEKVKNKLKLVICGIRFKMNYAECSNGIEWNWEKRVFFSLWYKLFILNLCPIINLCKEVHTLNSTINPIICLRRPWINLYHERGDQ